MPVESKELETWKLRKWRSKDRLPEALSKASHRFHVNENSFKDIDGDLRCSIKLKIRDESGRKFYASGVLIGKDLVSTSAHNFRYKGGPKAVSRAVSVTVYIGYHYQESSEGPPSKGIGVEKYVGTRVIVPQEWESSGFTWDNDRALVKLKREVTQAIPASYQAPSSGTSNIIVVGYPGDNTEQARGSTQFCRWAGCMYEVAGEAKLNNEGLLEYELSTMPGNSGGPVFLNSMPRIVIATHSCGDEENGINYAAPVDVAFIEACKAFLIQSHPTSHRYIVMQRQDNISSWYVSRTEGSWYSHVSASRPSKLRYATPILSKTERQRSQAKVVEQNSSSEEDEVEEGFVVLPSEPPHDVPSAQNYTRPWKWLRKRR